MSWTGESIDLRAVVQDTIDDWRSGTTPDAAGVLAEYPGLRDVKSYVLELALAEYNARTAAGDSVAADEFCERFPDHSRSIANLLEVQTFLDRCPAFAAGGEKSRWPKKG